MISVVTPWMDHPELIADYQTAMQGAEVIVVDNNSEPENGALLVLMVALLGGVPIRNQQNRWFAEANNQGLAVARGDVVMFCNNDIAAPAGWLQQVEREADHPDLLIGPSMLTQQVDGRAIAYLEGWCIAGRRETWERLGGWDAEAFPLPYWEDVDLCFRAVQMGMRLRKADWPIRHKSNTTSRHTQGAYSGTEANRMTFEARARAAWAG